VHDGALVGSATGVFRSTKCYSPYEVYLGKRALGLLRRSRECRGTGGAARRRLAAECQDSPGGRGSGARASPLVPVEHGP
jgi:hypothetical protein